MPKPASLRRAAIVAPIRTAVGKFGNALSGIMAGDLGAVVIKAPTERTGLDPSRVDDLVFAQGYGNGSGISPDHSIGVTGGRILANLQGEMRRRDVRFGFEAMGVGGGQGIAAIFERA